MKKPTWIECLIAWVFLVFASIFVEIGFYSSAVLAFGVFIILTPKN